MTDLPDFEPASKDILAGIDEHYKGANRKHQLGRYIRQFELSFSSTSNGSNQSSQFKTIWTA
ncbi:MAG: hypothetical protein LBC43_01280 [Bifidobacteriaceae bacterium]|jgi:hypothetical protein|nr:hypothetical protein [Bifidobacteriaceae bacterium]